MQVGYALLSRAIKENPERGNDRHDVHRRAVMDRPAEGEPASNPRGVHVRSRGHARRLRCADHRFCRADPHPGIQGATGRPRDDVFGGPVRDPGRVPAAGSVRGLARAPVAHHPQHLPRGSRDAPHVARRDPARARVHAICHRNWPGRMHAERAGADRRICAVPAARHLDDVDVHRLLARRSVVRSARCAPDPGCGMAGAVRHRRRPAAGACRDDDRVAAGERALPCHERQSFDRHRIDTHADQG